ncbi:response regulator, partial [Vibrio fluvialis]
MQPKVLLVEDATSLAILYQQYVKDEPFEFFHVETGAEAKKFIQRYLPHVVILDLNLPDIEGQEILDWIKENEFPTSVLIATAHGSVDIAVDLLRRGADDFLEKPIVAERLKASIHVHLKKIKLEHMVEDLKSTIER